MMTGSFMTWPDEGGGTNTHYAVSCVCVRLKIKNKKNISVKREYE